MHAVYALTGFCIFTMTRTVFAVLLAAVTCSDGTIKFSSSSSSITKIKLNLHDEKQEQRVAEAPQSSSTEPPSRSHDGWIKQNVLTPLLKQVRIQQHKAASVCLCGC